MARPERHAGSWIILPESPEEQALLDFARSRPQPALVLLGSYYSVNSRGLLLPSTTKLPSSARRIARIFAAAALAHQEALARRKSFSLLRSSASDGSGTHSPRVSRKT